VQLMKARRENSTPDRDIHQNITPGKDSHNYEGGEKKN